MKANVVVSSILFCTAALAQSNYKARPVGSLNSLGYKIYFERNGAVISPFHDIPLFADMNKKTFNMIVEIPRWQNAKLEINKETPLNPIMQDTLNGSLRYVDNIFPYTGYLWNYGAFPQTWEDPSFITPETSTKGDNDPIDVIEIGERIANPGDIIQVKVLGIIGLLDEGETDWKIVTINIKDPQAPNLTDIEDVDRVMPGLLEASMSFMTVYKVPAGKPKNQIAFQRKPRNKDYALERILETHEHWKALINGTIPPGDIQTINQSVNGSPYKASPESSIVANVPKEDPQPPTEPPVSIQKWHFVR